MSQGYMVTSDGCRLGKNGEIERLLNNEAQLRQEHEQQLLVERQQWCLEKDSLQKVLQEQQGTAHTLEQHLSAQITALRDELAKQHSGQQTAAHTHQDTLDALQRANQQLQQQHSKLQQDLQAALAYRHKCIQQKHELQQLRKHTSGAQLQTVKNHGSAEDVSDDQAVNPTAMTPQESAEAIDNPTSSSGDLAALVGLATTSVQQDHQHVWLPLHKKSLFSYVNVWSHCAAEAGNMPRRRSRTSLCHDVVVVHQVVKLKGERELVKRAYIEEKKKADR